MTCSRRHPHHSERGSLLIVAMILTAIIGISITSYLGLSRTGMTISNRALYNNGAMNLAENGLEEAMYSVNKAIADPSYTWTSNGWTAVGATDARRQLPASGTYTFDQGATGVVRVYVYNSTGGGSPRAVARSTITLSGNSAPIEKWVEVRLRRTSRFATGLVAKESILFKGNNVTVDSWDSDPDNDGSFIPFAPGIKKDNGSVGSISVSVDAVLVKNADVWGFVSTAGVDPTTGVGPNGSILGATSVYDPFTWTDPDVDPTRVSTDFSASFDNVATPAGGATIGSIGAAGTYGTAGAATTIVCDDISVSGNSKIVTFQGDVTLIILSTSQAIQITGNGSGIAVAANSSLKIYTAGDIALTGQGITNVGGAPADVQIYGTKTSSPQDIKIAGGGNFSGVVYAPYADVTILGDGKMCGSVVAENITLTGNAEFHYDESLAELDAGAPFRISLWKEITLAADRAALAADLSF